MIALPRGTDYINIHSQLPLSMARGIHEQTDSEQTPRT
jgi:hypothetical protein